MEIIENITLGQIVVYAGIISALYALCKKIYKAVAEIQKRENQERQSLEDIKSLKTMLEHLDEHITEDIHALDSKLQAGVLPLAKNRFFVECSRIFKQQEMAKAKGKEYYLADEKRQLIDTFYKGYKALGGNGIGDQYYKDICKIKIKVGVDDE